MIIVGSTLKLLLVNLKQLGLVDKEGLGVGYTKVSNVTTHTIILHSFSRRGVVGFKIWLTKWVLHPWRAVLLNFF